MNVIFLMTDTLRADHVAAFGRPAPWPRWGHEHDPFIETPALDRLAGEGSRFQRYYVSSYPTIPCRHDLYTGQFGFPTRGWEPLGPDEKILPEWLASRGTVSMLLFDTPALADDEYNFTRAFTGWDWVRGQHRDRWVTDPVSIALPAARYKTKSPNGLRLYLLNATRRMYERDWMCVKTAQAATNWLERNASHPSFFLWVDMWDPHDPFEAPPYDMRRYVDPGFEGEAIIYPKYGRADYLSAPELNDVRARYAAKVQLVDRAVGKIMDTVATLGLDHNTLVIHTTDHGHLFGEHGLQGKPTGPLGMLYEPTVRIPLIIRHPDGIGAGREVSAIVQAPDVTATILDAMGLDSGETAGQSLLPLMAGQGDHGRSYAFSGRFSRTSKILGAGASGRTGRAATFDGWVGLDNTSEPLTVTTEEWSLIVSPAGGRPPELYHLSLDPDQINNVYREYPTIAAMLHKELLAFLAQCGASAERYRAYALMGHEDADVVARPALGLETLFYVASIAGRLYGFLSPEEATANIPSASINPVSLQRLLSEDPHAMVCIGDQYFWVEDLRWAKTLVE